MSTLLEIPLLPGNEPLPVLLDTAPAQFDMRNLRARNDSYYARQFPTPPTSMASFTAPATPNAQVRGALRRAPGSQETKRCSFKEDIARDIQTGEVFTPTSMPGTKYRARFQERRRQEQRQQVLGDMADRAFEAAQRKLAHRRQSASPS